MLDPNVQVQPDADQTAPVNIPDDSAPSEQYLFELEKRHAELRAELMELDARLRHLRTAADLCPDCGGVGRRMVRGGLYGEYQPRPCTCSRS